MIKKKNQTHQNGITLIELFAALAALAVVLSFATAPLERVSARIQVDVAKHNVVQTLLMAKRAANRNNLPVHVSFIHNHDQVRLQPRFSHRRSSFRLDHLPAYTLPGNVAISHPGNFAEVAYAPGQTAAEGTIRLFSRLDPEYVVEISIADPG